MNKLTYLALLTYVLLSLSLITISTAKLSDSATKVSSNNLITLSDLMEPNRKRNKMCPCTVAIADFDDGPFRGLVTFAQDDSGCTFVTGHFGRGFEDKNATYKFRIVNHCGYVLDLTNELNVQLCGDGSTKSFYHKFDNFNLDCDNHGILIAKHHGYCMPYHKRADCPPNQKKLEASKETNGSKTSDSKCINKLPLNDDSNSE